MLAAAKQVEGCEYSNKMPLMFDHFGYNIRHEMCGIVSTDDSYRILFEVYTRFYLMI
jgi:hypothetical protein